MKEDTRKVLALVKRLDLVELATLLKEANSILKERREQKRKALIIAKKKNMIKSEHELLPLLNEMVQIDEQKNHKRTKRTK